MFGRKAVELIRSLERSAEETIPPYNAEAVRTVCEEIISIDEANRLDGDRRQQAFANTQLEPVPEGIDALNHSISFRQVALERNLRCLIAYHYNRLERLRNLRWSFGGIIPRELRATLSEKETEWFNVYNSLLAEYMEDNSGLNLAIHQKPPQELFVHVRVLKDYGNYETEEGEIIQLKRNTRHFMPRTECEHLIRQGILEHVPG